MNVFEINKIIGAILGILLLVMGVGFLAEAIYAPIEGRGVGYALPDANDETGHTEVAVIEEIIPLEVLLASASPEDGARVARKCQSCHNFGEGEGNKTGPALYGIVGHVIAANPDFSYSDILSEKNSAGDIWTYEALNDFIKSPKTYAPGTKMSFAGLSKDQDRVNMLAYLQTLSGSPVPFPTGQGDASVAETTVPVVEEVTPVVEETTPVVEAVTPVVEEAAPVVEAVTPVVEEAAPATETASAEQVPNFAALLANADIDKGARVARKCKACHGFKATDGNKVGPPLYDVVGRAMGSADGFKYSDTLSGMGADGGVWTYENLNEFVTKPRDFIDGTKMSFSGLRKEEDRVNLLAYLQSLSANPVAFPE